VGWQGAYTIERAAKWIEERDREGATLLVVDRSSRTPVGMMILFESDDEHVGRTVRLGYLLIDSEWGKGLASELVRGFVEWCRTTNIVSIVGGVERDNVPSQRVLEKNGFICDPVVGDAAELFFELRVRPV
jgi:RimJ/RimL family protein N-acetyltransferase